MCMSGVASSLMSSLHPHTANSSQVGSCTLMRAQHDSAANEAAQGGSAAP